MQTSLSTKRFGRLQFGESAMPHIVNDPDSHIERPKLAEAV